MSWLYTVEWALVRPRKRLAVIVSPAARPLQLRGFEHHDS